MYANRYCFFSLLFVETADCRPPHVTDKDHKFVDRHTEAHQQAFVGLVMISDHSDTIGGLFAVSNLSPEIIAVGATIFDCAQGVVDDDDDQKSKMAVN